MVRIVRVKNTTGGSLEFVGQTIAAGAYHDLQADELLRWGGDDVVFIAVGDGTLLVNKGADTTDDISEVIAAWAWLTAEDNQLDAATGKHTIHESSRPQMPGKTFHTYWSGAGDDMSTPAIGNGPMLEIVNAVSSATTSIEAQFHKDYGDVYLHEGYVQWENAGAGDHIDVEIVAKVTPLQQSTNLDYTIDAGVKIRAAAGGPGTGTDGLNGDPVFVPNPAGTGWWDVVSGSPVFSSGQTGAYDWYTIEITVNRFMNKIPVYGTSSSYIMLQSADATLLPNGYCVRVTSYNVSDTIWRAWMFMTLYREQTV